MLLQSRSILLSRLFISGNAFAVRHGDHLVSTSRMFHREDKLAMMKVDIEDSGNYMRAQDPSELFDIYPSPPSAEYINSIIEPDWGENYFPPRPTGRVKKRSQVHKDGDWHRSMHLWIYQPDSSSDDVRVLLQRRSPFKDTHPNLLDVSCAGHVNAGDDILETTMREMAEELGGNGNLAEMYSLEDIQNSKIFTITSSIEGETEKHGLYLCREYQDVFALKWTRDLPMKSHDFAPMVKEEVSGFEIISGQELMQKLRQGDDEFVPRSAQYIDALENAFGC